MGGAGGGRDRREAESSLKHPFRLKEQCCTLNMGCKLIQSTREAKSAVRSSLVPHAILLKALQGHEIHPRGLTTSVKSHL